MLPQEFYPEQLIGEIWKPEIADIKDVVDLHHLLRCIEPRYHTVPDADNYNLRHFEAWQHTVHDEPPQPDDASSGKAAEDPKAWRERFDCAAYTSFLLAATLAWAYSLPFLDGSRFADRLISRFFGHSMVRDLSVAELGHLTHQYPVYDTLGTLTHQDGVFGPLADWFVRSALQEYKDAASGRSSDVASYLAFRDKPMRLFDISPRSYIWPWDKSLSSQYIGESPEEGDAVFAAVMCAAEMSEFLSRVVKPPRPLYQP